MSKFLAHHIQIYLLYFHTALTRPVLLVIVLPLTQITVVSRHITQTDADAAYSFADYSSLIILYNIHVNH